MKLRYLLILIAMPLALCACTEDFNGAAKLALVAYSDEYAPEAIRVYEFTKDGRTFLIVNEGTLTETSK